MICCERMKGGRRERLGNELIGTNSSGSRITMIILLSSWIVRGIGFFPSTGIRTFLLDGASSSHLNYYLLREETVLFVC